MQRTLLTIGFSAICLVAAVWLIGVPSVHAESAPATQPDPAKAFATIAARGGEVYPPFYDYHVSPHAVVAAGRVFCAYQDTKGRPLVMAYDIDAEQWAGPVRASSHGLGGDKHGNPSLCIDARGRLHLFFGCHNDKMRHVRSKAPYSIEQWESAASPAKHATYPQSMRMADGRLFLLYRAGGHMAPWVLRISEDDGETWSDPEPVIEFRRKPKDPKAAAYCQFTPGAKRRTVHGFFVHKDDNPTRVEPHPWRPLRYPGLPEAVYRYNVYYIRRGEDGTWRSGRGTALDLPLSKAAADAEAMIYDSGSEFARIKQFTVDQNNQPYLRFQVGVVDWVRGGKVIVPPRMMYATIREDRWRVSPEPPAAWDEAVKRRLEPSGATAYPVPSPWYIRSTDQRLRPDTGSFIFLRHLENGDADREGGPAAPPK